MRQRQQHSPTSAMRAQGADFRPPIRAIELVGIPGTGKSTIAQKLETILEQAGVPTRSKFSAFADQRHFFYRQQMRLRLVLRCALSCGSLYRSSYGLIAQTQQRSTLDLAIVVSNFWSVVALMAEARTQQRDHVLIVDQGLLQAVWSVQLSSLRQPALNTWAPLLLASGLAETLVAYVQTDIAVCRGRLSTRNRNRTRLDLGTSDEQFLKWQLASQQMSELVDWAQTIMPSSAGQPNIVRVANDAGAPEAAAAEIASAYLERCRSIPVSAEAGSKEKRHEDSVPDHPNGFDRRGAESCPGPLTVVEAKRP